ncbi:TSL-kinase interacting protein 1 [Lolium perenne]|uniref:TSL-kinase interacting protein 1 n=1 Tax=Lolium perenne TaxID=4522 RepID=UPI0021F51C3E|nr:TSL-kinase interacting protein 1 [Lolium perenne]XP_051182375.1 TSL-kinase interacting protein 1 [Lolium perenne]
MEKEVSEEMSPPPQPVDSPEDTPPSESDPEQKPGKKTPRKWAAWTRQEEESFFNALRQVGKNFEKITLRVQSKNKDQVRHYYYRLVRRMKKLLGPEFSLDARNSKDIIAAMLRWWSLLDKFSCSASKLHLKPRRFKSFVDALGNQLLKDRKRTRRKCPRVEAHLSSAPILSKTPGNQSSSVELLPTDAQNGSKVASSKGALFKRVAEPNSVKSGVIKGDLSATRTVRQKRRAGGVGASAAYKKWERAAMAGVSLVADAAEELERNRMTQNLSNVDATMPASSPNNLSNVDATMPASSPSNLSTVDAKMSASSPKNLSTVDATMPASSPNNLSTVDDVGTNHMKEADPQVPSKLKLQLFPINEATRKSLEKDDHNPHLELTLSARKRMSSVLEHMNRKWGNSNIGCGELVLFPYCAHQEDLSTYQKWTTRDTVAVADVFRSVNSPSIFRLRYGWFSLADLEAGLSEMSLTHFENCMIPEDIQVKSSSEACLQKDGTLLSDLASEKASCKPKDRSSALLPTPSSTGKNAEEEQSMNVPANQALEVDPQMNYVALPEVGWADTLTDISVGYLLTEASKAANMDCEATSTLKNALFHVDPCSYDSFDAAVALHTSHYQAAEQPAHTSHSTIWGAEETCDEFSFKLATARKQEGSNTSASSPPDSDNEVHSSNSEGFLSFLEDLAGKETPDNLCADDAKDTDELCPKSPPQNNNDSGSKDQSLADIFWADSLEPLDLDIPPVRYQADDFILGNSDNDNSWNRMMENSMDAFRNLSFFAADNFDSVLPIM